ncbi:hypothetical protein IW150_007664, partial [Coemansia sp. RSA 2607]
PPTSRRPPATSRQSLPTTRTTAARSQIFRTETPRSRTTRATMLPRTMRMTPTRARPLPCARSLLPLPRLF